MKEVTREVYYEKIRYVNTSILISEKYPFTATIRDKNSAMQIIAKTVGQMDGTTKYFIK